MMKRAAALGAFALVLAACGGESSGPTSYTRTHDKAGTVNGLATTTTTTPPNAWGDVDALQVFGDCIAEVTRSLAKSFGNQLKDVTVNRDSMETTPSTANGVRSFTTTGRYQANRDGRQVGGAFTCTAFEQKGGGIKTIASPKWPE